MTSMRILALEPYYGGSHRSFTDSWISRSRHDWTLLTLPPYKWKWRMRHSAITFAEEIKKLDSLEFDLLFCSDMLNLAEFTGLVPDKLSTLPKLVYFHENQLTYPSRFNTEKDMHFAYTNFCTALTADHIWFNSNFHMNEFLDALELFLKRMPDYQHSELVNSIRNKSAVNYPGINLLEPIIKKNDIPNILWAARWEHDKNPELFFEAVDQLLDKGLKFSISVIGESFKDSPEIFFRAEKKYSKIIRYFGYQESYKDYLKVLGSSDIIVSTADHEFFGIAVVEAISAGAIPCLPYKLAYPEVLDVKGNPEHKKQLYKNRIELVELLEQLITNHTDLKSDLQTFVNQKYNWTKLSEKYDNLLEEFINK